MMSMPVRKLALLWSLSFLCGCKGPEVREPKAAAISSENIHGAWTFQDVPAESRGVLEYRPNGDFVGTIVEPKTGLAEVVLGKWVMQESLLALYSNQMINVVGQLIEVDSETNTILTWTSDQITFKAKDPGTTNTIVRVDKQTFLGNRAASSSRLSEEVLRKERANPRGVYRRGINSPH